MIRNSLFLLLLLTSLCSAQSDSRSFNKIIYDNNIDVSTKSLKAWIRIFNSQERIDEYGYKLSAVERFTVLKGFKDRQKRSKNKYSRRLQ